MTTRRGSLMLYFILVFAFTWGIAALLLLLPNQMTALFGPMSARNPLFFLAVYAPTLSANREVNRPVQSRGNAEVTESSHV